MALLLRNAHLVDPAEGLDGVMVALNEPRVDFVPLVDVIGSKAFGDDFRSAETLSPAAACDMKSSSETTPLDVRRERVPRVACGRC